MFMNWVMEKSAAKEACFPSLPSIPIPTFAAFEAHRRTPSQPMKNPAPPIKTKTRCCLRLQLQSHACSQPHFLLENCGCTARGREMNHLDHGNIIATVTDSARPKPSVTSNQLHHQRLQASTQPRNQRKTEGSLHTMPTKKSTRDRARRRWEGAEQTFCVGEQRQHTTAGVRAANEANRVRNRSAKQ